MSEKRRYFDLEIGDDIRFHAGSDECHYPFTFTVEECVEEYCAMRDMELMRIERDDNGEVLRTGAFWYKREDIDWTNAFKNVKSVQQVVMNMGMSMRETADAMSRVQAQMAGWWSHSDRWHCGSEGDDEDG